MLQFTEVRNPDDEYQEPFGYGTFKYTLHGETYYGHDGQFIGFVI